VVRRAGGIALPGCAGFMFSAHYSQQGWISGGLHNYSFGSVREMLTSQEGKEWNDRRRKNDLGLYSTSGVSNQRRVYNSAPPSPVMNCPATNRMRIREAPGIGAPRPQMTRAA